MSSKVCATCSKEITGQILSALSRNYHPDHFLCHECKKPIKGSKFQSKDNEPYCDDCFTKLFAPTCSKCKKPIKERVIKALNTEWHEECFSCASCKKPLSGGSFFDKDSKPYCKDCYHNVFGSVCKNCNKTIVGEVLKALDANWHPDCFKCGKCKKPITEESFQVENGHPLCKKCEH